MSTSATLLSVPAGSGANCSTCHPHAEDGRYHRIAPRARHRERKD